MRPLPTTTPAAPAAAKPLPAILAPQTLELGPLGTPHSPGPNRRTAAYPIQRGYPWLLVASTGLAAIFCGLYLTKPVIVAGHAPGPMTAANPPFPDLPAPAPARPSSSELLLPGATALPGDASKPLATDPRRLPSAAAGPESAYEETNLQIQHVLNAQGPQGEDLGKINLKVPVLYRSRALRWTPDEVAQARALMTRIGNYQEASRMIRDEGQKLLGEWNALVGESIPATVLRADSPSLTGQAPTDDAANLDSTQAIELRNR